MKKYLKNVPEKQRKEIRLIAKELTKIKWVEKIILFWSFARWDFVLRDATVENWTSRVYKSDYDILVVLRFYKKSQRIKFWKRVREIKEARNINRSVKVIFEWITHINKMISEQRYFYMDILREWVLLFDKKQFHFRKVKALKPNEILKKQKEDFKVWVELWAVRLELFSFSIKSYSDSWTERFLKEGAFLLHQTIEAYTTAYLLVKTGYRPKTHDLGDFIEFLVELDSTFNNWFDLTDPEEERKYELLKKAYIEARYSYKYIITKEELEFLKNKALFLQEKIIKLCRAEIEKSKSLALT